MPEEVKDEGLQDAEERGVLPTPEVSAGSADAGSAQSGIDVDALVEKLVPKIDEAVDRRFKSDKDRRWDRFDKSMAKMDDILQYVQKAGGDVDKIAPELRDREIMSRLEQLEGSGGDPGRSPVSDLQAVAAEILSKAGIKFDDQIVTEWAGKQYASEKAAVEDLTRSVVKKVKQDVGVSPSAVVGQSGAPPGDPEDTDSIAAELQAIQRGQHGNPHSDENIKRRAELRQKLMELDPEVSLDDPNVHVDTTSAWRDLY